MGIQKEVLKELNALIGGEERRWCKCLVLDSEVANPVVRGVSGRFKAGRTAKKRGRNVSWSKNLVRKRVTVSSDEDSDEERGVAERRHPLCHLLLLLLMTFSSSSDSEGDSKPDEDGCGEVDLTAGLDDEYGETDVEEESEEKGEIKTEVERSESVLGMEQVGKTDGLGEEVDDSDYEVTMAKVYP